MVFIKQILEWGNKIHKIELSNGREMWLEEDMIDEYGIEGRDLPEDIALGRVF